mmetsp:Transcript_35713/g.94625  ORF Transcript_35713/g.94625 Transcript_35713/m.94625 type:complete len:569 (-) Transcript_35713:41-1747(-)
MSGRIIIRSADGSDATSATGGELPYPEEMPLYSVPARGTFDTACGTTGVEAYAIGGALACPQSFLTGTMDTEFERCMQAIDCLMNKQMRVMGHDSHQSAIVTFMQQMIPHHVNAINMAKILLKQAPTEVASVEGFGDILWDIINVQNYQVHQFRNYLAGSAGYGSIVHNGDGLIPTSVGEHCGSALDVDVTIPASREVLDAAENVTGCDASDTHHCVNVNLLIGETGNFEFAGLTGPSPDVTVQIGKTYTFDQADATNWYHPMGFAYYPDGAHGDTWGGAERAEVEGAGELLYKINGAPTTCPDAGDTGLDCYEPEFFYPRGEWTAKHYQAELTITQAMADMSHGGVIYYFCHIHSKMSGRIIIQNADGSPVTKADGTALANPTELTLYAPTAVSGVDVTCGTDGVAPYSGGGAMACSERFLCGALDTNFEKCMQAIDCKMKTDMTQDTSPDQVNKVAVFMQQMIPHHQNAVNMARIQLKQVPAAEIYAAIEGGGFTDALYGIVNNQNYQIHQFRNYLGPLGLLPAAAAATATTTIANAPPDVSSARARPGSLLAAAAVGVAGFVLAL